MTPALPLSHAALAAILVLLFLGLLAAVVRLLKKPAAEFTPNDRIVGYLLLGKHFLRIHARVQAGGLRPGPKLKAALLAGVLLAALLIAGALSGQKSAAQQELRPNGLLLVAKPGLQDPNFGGSVVLVTQTPDFHTVGVILNRPTRERHRGKPLAFGGPVMPRVVVAVFRAAEPPKASAFHVLKDLYLSMNPENVDALLAGRNADYRLFAGFSGWAPRQLESEFGRASWFVLPADAAIVFRKDTAGLWEELVARATKPQA
jgi:putative transcriptional regulator